MTLVAILSIRANGMGMLSMYWIEVVSRMEKIGLPLNCDSSKV